MEKICLRLFSLQKIDENKFFIKKQPLEGFSKKGVLKQFRKIHLKTPVLESYFNRVSGLRIVTLLKKETPTQVFSGKFYEISKNTFYTEHLRNLSHSFISERSFTYLFKPPFVRKMDKIHNFAIFSFCQYLFRQWDKRTIFIKCRTEVTNVKKRSWENVYKKRKKK